MNKDRGVYCDHLEARLPKMSTHTSVSAMYSDKIELYPSGFDLYVSSTEEGIRKILNALKKYGMSRYEVELLVARFVEEKTLKEVKKEQGWTSIGSARYFLKQALKKLKERKFKI